MQKILALLLILCISGCESSADKLTVSGRIEVNDVNIGSKIGGRVEKVYYREGQNVKAGEVIVLLDDEELQAQAERAKEALAQVQAQLDLLLAGTRKEELQRAEATVRARRAELNLREKGFRAEEVMSAEARVEQAKSDLDLASKEYNRAQQLFRNRTINQQELDERRSAFDRAQAQLSVQQQQLDLVRSGSRPEEIEQSQALLEQAQASLDELRAGARKEEIAAQRAAVAQAKANLSVLVTQLKEMRIVAPADARVEAMDLEPGDLIKAGESVARLTLQKLPYVRCYVPENRLGWVRPGVKVLVTVDSFPGETFEGLVRYVATEAEFTPRNVQTTEKRSELSFETRVDIIGSDERLRPGMFADVHISYNKSDSENAASQGAQ